MLKLIRGNTDQPDQSGNKISASSKEKMKSTYKNETLKTEFVVEGKLDSIYSMIEETVSANNFILVPFRFSENTSTKKIFQVISTDRLTQRRISCGAIELIKQKEKDAILLRLDSTKSIPGSSPYQGSIPMERVFYLVLQQLIQRGITFTSPAKRDQTM